MVGNAGNVNWAEEPGLEAGIMGVDTYTVLVMAKTEYDRAHTLINLGDTEKALKYLLEALAIFKNIQAFRQEKSVADYIATIINEQ